jgi:hypothetical protein
MGLINMVIFKKLKTMRTAPKFMNILLGCTLLVPTMALGITETSNPTLKAQNLPLTILSEVVHIVKDLTDIEQWKKTIRYLKASPYTRTCWEDQLDPNPALNFLNKTRTQPEKKAPIKTSSNKNANESPSKVTEEKHGTRNTKNTQAPSKSTKLTLNKTTILSEVVHIVTDLIDIEQWEKTIRYLKRTQRHASIQPYRLHDLIDQLNPARASWFRPSTRQINPPTSFSS